MMDQEPDIGDDPLPPPTPEEERAEAWEYWHQRATKFETALHAIAGFGSVNLAGEWENGLRDIIRSMTDCAKAALKTAE